MAKSIVGRKVKVVGSITGVITSSDRSFTQVLGVNGTEYGIPTSQIDLIHTYEVVGYKLTKNPDTGELESNGGLFIEFVETAHVNRVKLAKLVSAQVNRDGFEITSVKRLRYPAKNQ